MSRTPGRIALCVLLALIALLIAAKLRYPGKATVKLPPADCNADLWKYVYSPERLSVIEACTAVEGRVISVHRAVDGDLHIALDPDQKSILNLTNAMHAQRRLIVEVVCDHPSVKNQAGPACEGFVSAITSPNIGDHIRVTGAYVTDRDNGWNEIHPVTRIETLH
ncbi:MAG TPA: hypothetical protein VLA83_08900 [Candidatus Binatia bacterium]|nr:hypothetical protein [Candidatus Binatia bacterium]